MPMFWLASLASEFIVAESWGHATLRASRATLRTETGTKEVPFCSVPNWRRCAYWFLSMGRMLELNNSRVTVEESESKVLDDQFSIFRFRRMSDSRTILRRSTANTSSLRSVLEKKKESIIED